MSLEKQTTNNQPRFPKVSTRKTSARARSSNHLHAAEPERGGEIIHPHCRFCGRRHKDIYRPSSGICAICLNKEIDNNDKELYAEPIFVKGSGTNAV